MQQALRYGEESPMIEMNTTPLIDILLVLLIMFIVTIPLATHSVKLDLPTGPLPPVPLEPEVHVLEMNAAGTLRWDGAPVSEAALPERLRTLRATLPAGVLHFRTDGAARYEDFDRVLAAVKRERVERLGFLGNERFSGAIAR